MTLLLGLGDSGQIVGQDRWKRGNPGCPCCHVCMIDRLPQPVSMADATEVIRPTLHPQEEYAAWVRAQFRLAAGATALLFIAWDDAEPGDGLYVELTAEDTPTLGTLQLFRKDGTPLADAVQVNCVTPDVWHTLRICYDPVANSVEACVDVATPEFIYRNQCISEPLPEGFVAGRLAGYGTSSGDAEMQGYRFDRLWYLGTGVEPYCCVVDVAESVAGVVPHDGPMWIFDFSGCGNFSFNLAGPGGAGEMTGFWPMDFDLFLETLNLEGNTESGWIHPAVTGTQDGDRITLFGDAWFLSDESGYVGTEAITLGDCVGLIYQENDNETGTDAVQSITPSRLTCVFRLTFDGETTAWIGPTATASDVQSALEGLTTIGAGNVSVSGNDGGPYTVTFQGDLGAQPVELLTAEASTDCVPGEFYYDDQRRWCHQCHGDNCEVVVERFEGSEDGPLPCPWVDNEDWGVVNHAAAGEGIVAHKFDPQGGLWDVQATFALGELATIGDSTVIGLVSAGDVVYSMTITRTDTDEYTVEWYPPAVPTYTIPFLPAQVVLKAGSFLLCSDQGEVIPTTFAPTAPFGVSITQPTLSGHTDTTLLGFVVSKSRLMDERCEDGINCPTTCEDFCIDGIWPEYWLVELDGLETHCCNLDSINGNYYANRYAAPCHSYGFGDDDLGICFDPGWEPNYCCQSTHVIPGFFPRTVIQTIWLIASDCETTDGMLTLRYDDNPNNDDTIPFPSDFREQIDGEWVYYPLRVDVRLWDSSYFDILFDPSLITIPEDATHAIIVTVARLVLVKTVSFSGAGNTSSIAIRTIGGSYYKFFSAPTDCDGLEEDLPHNDGAPEGHWIANIGNDDNCSDHCLLLGTWVPVESGPLYPGYVTSASTARLTAL